MNKENLENQIEFFDTEFPKIEIEMKEIVFDHRYKQNNILSSITLIGASIMETIGAYGVITSGHEALRQGVAIAAAAVAGYGVNTLLTGNSKFAHAITKHQLGYEPKSLEKDILNVVSVQ
jgi:hypothetical protein